MNGVCEDELKLPYTLTKKELVFYSKIYSLSAAYK